MLPSLEQLQSHKTKWQSSSWPVKTSQAAAATVATALAWPALIGVGYAIVVGSKLQSRKVQLGLISVMIMASLVAQGAWLQIVGGNVVAAISSEPEVTATAPEQSEVTNGQVAAATTEDSGPQTAQVLKVLSGDRMEVNWNDQAYTVRLIGVLAPDPGDAKYPPACFGIEAQKHLEGLIGNGQITLTKDDQLPDRDGSGQLIRYAAGPDGSIINRQMIDSGMAKESGSEGYVQKVSFIAAQEAAKAARRGWWGTCNVEEDFENAQKAVESSPTVTPTPSPTPAIESNVVQPVVPTPTVPTPTPTLDPTPSPSI